MGFTITDRSPSFSAAGNDALGVAYDQSTNSIWIWNQDDGHSYTSTNGGQSWTDQGTNVAPGGAAMKNARLIPVGLGGDGNWMIMRSGGTRVYKATDFVTWGNGQILTVSYEKCDVNTKYMAMCKTSALNIAYNATPLASTWAEFAITSTASIPRAVKFGFSDDLFSCHTNGDIVRMTDGSFATESLKTTPVATALNHMAYDGSSIMVAVGDSGVILTSADGNTWTSRTSGLANNIDWVVYDGTQFWAMSNEFEVIHSVDGITWTSVTDLSASTETLNAPDLLAPLNGGGVLAVYFTAADGIKAAEIQVGGILPFMNHYS